VQWVNGNPAMIFMGAWLPAEMKPQMPAGFTTDMFAFPNIDGGKGNDVVEHWANVFAVMKDSQSPDAAVNFIKYLMSPDVVKAIVETGTPVPIVDAPIPAGLENQYKILGASKEVIPARAGLNTEIAEYMNNVYNVCTDKFFQLQDTPEAYIDCLATSSAAYWSAHPEITEPAS
jgi:ABC-type glycerol-3-phosphate transport system substrate-binding protein